MYQHPIDVECFGTTCCPLEPCESAHGKLPAMSCDTMLQLLAPYNYIYTACVQHATHAVHKPVTVACLTCSLCYCRSHNCNVEPGVCEASCHNACGLLNSLQGLTGFKGAAGFKGATTKTLNNVDQHISAGACGVHQLSVYVYIYMYNTNNPSIYIYIHIYISV